MDLLARHLAGMIAANPTGRVSIETLRVAAVEAEPALAGAPDVRERLATALRAIAAEGGCRLPAERGAGWDRRVYPPLPLHVWKPIAVRPTRPAPEPVTWTATLGWAAAGYVAGRWSPDEARLLRGANRLLVAGGPARTVPIAERSLELTGDPKLLDRLSRNAGLFAPGRLSLELLGAERTPPPFPWVKVGDGPVLLVSENGATFRTLSRLAPTDGPVGLVAFGGGHAFPAAVEFIAELPRLARHPGIRAIRYFGDLDEDGLEVAIRATDAARRAGLPPIAPAVGLYARLLRWGTAEAVRAVDPARAATLVEWLPKRLASGAFDRLTAGERLAQEAVSTDRLTGDSDWCSWPNLGPIGIGRTR